MPKKSCPDNCPQGKLPPVSVSVWFRVSVKIKVGGQFSSGTIVLEPYYMNTLGSFVFSELALLTRDVLCSKR